MKNNLLNKFLMPSYVAAVLFLGAAATTTYFAQKEVQTAKNNSDNPDVVDNSKTTFFFCMFVVTVSFIMSVFCGIKYPQFIYKRTKIMTKHYLQDIFVRYPEMIKYSYVLENPDKMREIAAVVCNGLTKQEQKELLKFIKKELDDMDRKSSVFKFRRIERELMKTVQKHAEKDPAYMNEILMTIVNSQKPNIAETAQKVK